MSELSGGLQKDSHPLEGLVLADLVIGDSISGIASFDGLKTLAEQIIWEQDETFEERPASFSKRIELVENAVRGPFKGSVVFTGTHLVKNGIIIDYNTKESRRGYLFENNITFKLTGKPSIDSRFGLAVVHSPSDLMQIRAYDLEQRAFDVIQNVELDDYHSKSKKMGAGALSVAKKRPTGTTGHL